MSRGWASFLLGVVVALLWMAAVSVLMYASEGRAVDALKGFVNVGFFAVVYLFLADYHERAV